MSYRTVLRNSFTAKLEEIASVYTIGQFSNPSEERFISFELKSVSHDGSIARADITIGFFALSFEELDELYSQWLELSEFFPFLKLKSSDEHRGEECEDYLAYIFNYEYSFPLN